MEEMGIMPLPLLMADMERDKYLSPEEYTYWMARNNRTFYIDYELTENYELMELGKIIVQLNMEEMNIPKEQLKPIYLWIHSYGGDLDQANAVIDIIQASRIPIVTIAMGAAMSAGFMLLLAGHRRYAFKHSNLMVHEGSAAFSGTAEQIEQAQKNYKKQINEMKAYIIERTAIDEKLFNKNKSKDWYLAGEELITYKIVDKLVTSFDDIF